MEKCVEILENAINQAYLNNKERLDALKRLNSFKNRKF